MKTLQLFKDGRELLGSDGIMYVDGRFNMASIRNQVKQRNSSYEKNFQHKLADSFAIYKGRINGGTISKTYSL